MDTLSIYTVPMKNTKKWSPLALRRTMKRIGFTSRDVAFWLTTSGHPAGSSTVRRWTQDGDDGPKMPATAALIRSGLRLAEKKP